MDAGVFVLKDDNSLIRMKETPYDAETALQRMLADHPDLLAGDQIDPSSPRRWLLIDREAGIPAELDGGNWWSVDHLFLDQDAVPTFVETKRSSDTRARREVVAQMLDYAANATEYWPVDRMREGFAHRCGATGVDRAEELRDILGVDGDEEAYWQLAQRNLREGRIRLLFVADKIPASLRRIVEFLNRQMNPAEVLAVEIRQFSAAGETTLRTLVPRVIGQTEQVRETKSRVARERAWVAATRDEYLEPLAPHCRATALAVLQAADAVGFATSAYRLSGALSTSILITVDGVPNTPITLSGDTLWVSLGRYHEALREPNVNQRIREAILQVAPATRQALNPKKTEVGIALDSIGLDGLGHLEALLRLVRSALASG